MSDVHSQKKRSYNMSRIRGRDTKPELHLRKELWRRGFRYRLKSNLPGKPDIVFPRKRLVVFVDGCFWHKCPEHYIPPKGNSEFWRNKIETNVERDKTVNEMLRNEGWAVLRFWEHEIKDNLAGVADTIALVMSSN